MGNTAGSNFSCACRFEPEPARPEDLEEEPRRDSSETLKRSIQDERVGTPSISRAAVQAAARHAAAAASATATVVAAAAASVSSVAQSIHDATMSMVDARSVEEEQEPAKKATKRLHLPPGAIMKPEVHQFEYQEESSDSEDLPLGSRSGGDSKKSRTPKRRAWKRLSITETMPVSPSSALQIVINNPGKLESFYSVDQGRPLGKGSFGVVKRAYVSSTKAQRAVKFIAIERMREKLNVLKAEIEIMKAVDHPNIIMLYEIFEDQKYLCLVMELCTGGTLLSRLKYHVHFPEALTAICMNQILRAVFYLHRNWIVHRDLKAENILVSSTETVEKTLLKVSDFGLSTTFRPKQLLTEKVGTLTHMSPEVLDRRYTQSCDVWACGVIMYNLVSGSIPWCKEEEIRVSRINFTKYWCDASQECAVFQKRLLSRPSQRPTAERALQDAFLAKALPQMEEMPPRYGLLDELKLFRSCNKLKRASLTTIASLLADEHVKAARDLFISMDVDGDGQISVAEVERQLRSLKEEGKVDKAMNRREVERVFRDWDADKSGQYLKDFTYTEFLAATFDRKTCLTEAVCREAFNSLDKNKDGCLDLAELHTGQLLGHIDMDELKDTLEDLDQNGDSLLDFPEYMQMLRAAATAKTPKSCKSSRQPSFGLSLLNEQSGSERQEKA